MQTRPPLLERPLEVEPQDEGVLLRTPDGAPVRLSRQAARATTHRLLKALEDSAPQEIYQKPLG